MPVATEDRPVISSVSRNRFLKVLRNFSWLAAAQFFFRFAYFGLVAVLARTVSIEDYALLTLLLVYTGLWAPLFNFGLGIIGVREMAQRNITAPEFTATFLPLKLAVSAIGLAAIIAVGWLLGYADGTPVVLALMGTATVAVSLAEFFHLPFTAHERMHATSMLTMAERAAVVGFSCVGVILGFGAVGFAIGHAAGALAGLAIAVVVYRRTYGAFRTRIDGAAIRWYLKESLPIALNWFFAMAYSRFGVILLEQIRPDAEVAVFNTAFFLLISVQTGITILMHSIYPAMSAGQKASREKSADHLRTGLLYGFVIAVLVTPVITLGAGIVIPFVFGTDFSEVGKVASVLLWLVPLFGVNNLVGTYLQAGGRQAAQAKVTAIGMVVNWLIAIPLGLAHGSVGIALGTVVSEMTITVLLVLTVSRIHSRFLDRRQVGAIAFGLFVIIVNVVNSALGGSQLLALASAVGMAALAAVGRRHSLEVPDQRIP